MDRTTICNLALSNLKSGIEITNAITEQSQAAKACRRYYEILRDELQGGYAWNFNKKTADLAVVETNPTRVWAFSFTYPSDCLMARRIVSVARDDGTTFTLPSNALVAMGAITAPIQDTQNSAIPFEVASGLIYTNMPNAQLEYSFRNEDETTWPAKFCIAMGYGLAAYIAPRMTDGDPFNMIQKMTQLLQMKLSEARSQNANERLRIQTDSEFTRDR